MGFRRSGLIAWISFGIETFGGVLIIFGLFTQIAAFFLIGNMAVAVYIQASKKKITLIMHFGRSGWELPLIFLVGFTTIFLLVAGDYSLDAKF